MAPLALTVDVPPAGAPRDRPQSPRFATMVVATVAAATAILLVLGLVRPARHKPSPKAGLTVIAGTINTVPAMTPAQRDATTADLSAFLRVLYERAFLSAARKATRSPDASPASTPVESFFTPQAALALERHPDVFDAGRASVAGGVLHFDGVVTGNGARLQALLDVAFDAKGVVRGADQALTQEGTLLVVRSGDGWRVAGFELQLHAEPATPSPTASRA